MLQWDEPAYFLDRSDESRTVANIVSRPSWHRQWAETVLGTPLPRAILWLVMLVTFIAFVLAVGEGNLSLSGIAAAVGVAVAMVLAKGQKLWSAAFRAPELHPRRVMIDSSAVVLTIGGKAHSTWSYRDIVRAQVGVVQYEEGSRPVLRLKVRGTGWCDINIAPEISLAELTQFLRLQGLPVREQVKRRWYE